MTTDSARRDGRRIVLLSYASVTALDVVGPAEVFATANFLAGTPAEPLYDLRVVSVQGGLVETGAHLAIQTQALSTLDGETIDTLILPGGSDVWEVLKDQALMGWIMAVAARARRTVSVCVGAFLLAEAGLLEGRRAVTHWAWSDKLAVDYPRTVVEADPIFIQDGRVWTSAGVSAGIDLALALVEDDHGARLAMEVAKRLVVFLKRPGAQPQFSALLGARLADAGRFSSLHSWIAGNLKGDLRVEKLAEHAGMSPRTFARVYASVTGTTPARGVEQIRLEAARHLLSETSMSVAAVAVHCGLRIEQMRRAFVRQFGVSPSDYRSTSASGPAAARAPAD